MLKSILPKTDIQTLLLLIFLMFMFLDYGGYGYYVFYLSFLYIFYHKGFKLIDKNFFLLLTWGLSVGIITFTNFGNFNYGSILMPIINCPILYLVGKYLVLKNDLKVVPIIIFVIVLALALISVISVLKDISINGFLVSAMGRNVPLIGYSSSFNVAATGISSRLIPIVTLCSFILLPLSTKEKILIVGCAFICLICGVRIQSRTLVLTTAIAFFLMTVFSWRSLSISQKIVLLLVFIFSSFLVLYVLNTYSSQLGIIERFQGDELESGGGRTYRLIAVAENMFKYPLGAMPNTITYAHNLWFDCARSVGLLPFMMLVFISIKYLITYLKVDRLLHGRLILKSILLLQSFSLFILFMFEPILEGIPMLFQYFCVLFGIIVALKSRLNRCN